MEYPLPPRFQPGMIVVSTKGHDRGRLYLLLALKGDKRLLLADGRARGYVDAKLKNTKHVRILGQAIDDQELDRILEGQQCESECNTMIRKLIAEWVQMKETDKE